MARSKSFKTEMAQQSTTNPAETYMSKAKDTREYKHKRLNLMIKPSVHENVAKLAAMKRKSVNELINNVLEKYVSDNSDLLAKYDEWVKMNDTFVEGQ